MEISRIISETNGYNFHTHTQFCDGHDEMQAFVEAAADCGFKHLGFSPHSPIVIPSPCNMAVEDVARYRAELVRLQELTDTKLYMGMEIDFLSAEHGPAAAYFRDLELDYSIGSVHFIPTRNGNFVDIDGSYERFTRNMREHFNDDIDYVVKTFYEQSAKMIDAGCFDILGHFDKIAQNGALYQPGLEDEAWYQDIMEQFITHVIESGVMVEINTKAFEKMSRFFPHERYWQRLIDAGVTMPVNSDAHYAARLTADREEAFTRLKKYGRG